MDGIDSDKHAEALRAFTAAQDAEANNRAAALADIRFVKNSEQWPDDIRRQRERDGRPCLTVNKLSAFVRQVCNQARQNKPSIKTKSVDYQADPDTAKVIDGLIRNIEYISNADAAYDTAIEHAVLGGVGYIRVSLDYAYDDVFEMDLKIDRVPDQFAVFGDPHSLSEDSRDWNSAFVVEWMDCEEFERKYKSAEKVDWQYGEYHNLPDGWAEDNRVMVAEWWTRTVEEKAIVQLSDGTVIGADVFEMHAEAFLAAGQQVVNTRKVDSHKVTQYILSGAEVLETNDFPGQFIPIIPVYGEDYIIDGERHLRGLVHNATDSQRMYNYWRTVSTELVALAPKTPWLARQGSLIDPTKWASSGTENHAFLEYRGDLPPQRQMVDPTPAGTINEALSANDDIKAVIGMYEASFGAQSNETSGAAIWARKSQGDVATFHFVDNLVRAIRHLGRVIVGLIPHVYNSARVIRVLGEDGKESQAEINSSSGMYDLTTGKYDIVVTAGSSYTTRKEEAAYQMTELLRSFPEAAPIVAPLLAKNLDWPESDKIQQQFEEMEAQKQRPAPPPQMSPDKERELEIKAYDAETKRLQATSENMTPEQIQAMIMQTLQQVLTSPDVNQGQQPVQQPPIGGMQ